MIKAGETVNAKKEMRFFLADTTSSHAGITGHSFSGSEITVCAPGASSFSNFAGTVLELGGGHYAYRPTAGELASGGNAITARIVVASAVSISISDDVVAFDPQAIANLGLTDLDATVSSVNTAVAGVQADTDNIQTRLPAALDGSGNMKAGVQSIVNNAITTASLTDGFFTAAKFAANAITGTVVADGFITNTKVADGLISAAKFAANAITSTVVADGFITNAKIADATLSVAKFVDGCITAAKFGANAITATVLASGAITNAKFAANAIDSTVLADGAVAAGKIGAAAITTSSIADAAITNSKIADGLITVAKLADNAIVAAKLATDARNAIRDAVLNGVIDGTRTVKGVMARMNALVRGKAAGLLGTVATFYLEDGTTKAMEFTQSTSLGTRVAASTTNGD